MIGSPLTKGRALKRGAALVKGTLEKVKGKMFKPDVAYKISPLAFRAPKREAGMIFIQRGGKERTFIRGARLASAGERREFKLLRRGKNVKFI